VTGSGEAGFLVAYMLAEKNVKLVIARKVEENMDSALKEKGINFREELNKKVEEIILFFLKKENGDFPHFTIL